MFEKKEFGDIACNYNKNSNSGGRIMSHDSWKNTLFLFCWTQESKKTIKGKLNFKKMLKMVLSNQQG